MKEARSHNDDPETDTALPRTSHESDRRRKLRGPGLAFEGHALSCRRHPNRVTTTARTTHCAEPSVISQNERQPLGWLYRLCGRSYFRTPRTSSEGSGTAPAP